MKVSSYPYISVREGKSNSPVDTLLVIILFSNVKVGHIGPSTLFKG